MGQSLENKKQIMLPNENLLVQLPQFSDARGKLTVMQNALPFEIKRVYWISASDGSLRGGHRHQSTTQALLAISGHIEIFMDDGTTKQFIQLTSQSECLIVQPQHWHTMRFIGNSSILLVFSSSLYDAKEYIDEPYE